LAIPLIKLKLHIDGRLLIANHLPKIQWRNRGGREGGHYEKRNALLLDEKICFIKLPPHTLEDLWQVIPNSDPFLV